MDASTNRLDETARGPEWVDGGVDTDLDQRPLQSHRRAQVSENGLDGWVGVIVRRHVNSLHRRDRPLARRGDALLQLAHLGRERGLIADGAGHAAEQGGDFGVGLHEAENVVDEEDDVLAFFVAKIFGDCHSGQCDAGARAGRLVHLAVHQRGFRDDA